MKKQLAVALIIGSSFAMQAKAVVISKGTAKTVAERQTTVEETILKGKSLSDKEVKRQIELALECNGCAEAINGKNGKAVAETLLTAIAAKKSVKTAGIDGAGLSEMASILTDLASNANLFGSNGQTSLATEAGNKLVGMGKKILLMDGAARDNALGIAKRFNELSQDARNTAEVALEKAVSEFLNKKNNRAATKAEVDEMLKKIKEDC